MSTQVLAKAEKGSSFGISNRYGAVTPSQVYSLLENYEKVFMTYVKTHKKSLLSKIRKVRLKPVKSMKPEQAFVKLHQLSDAIDKLVRRVTQKPMKRVKREKRKAIPAEVYLQAAYNLDAFVHYMNKVEPNKNWGRFYVDNVYRKNKKPSDVYALADVSLRRLMLVLK
ncbi:MAG: hypothetical protein ACC707_11820 [Thiohalomonadales bacterium]